MTTPLSAVTIAPADACDAPAVARLMYEAAPELSRYVFGTAALPFMEAAYRRGRGTWTARYTRCAYRDGQLLGVITWYPGWRGPFLALDGLCFMLQALGLRQGVGCVARSLRVLRLFRPIPLRAVYVANLAIVEGYRGQGLGSQLLQAVLTASRQRGAPSVVMDVSMSNPDARRLYERLGWTPGAESPGTAAVPGVIRLTFHSDGADHVPASTARSP